MRSQWIWRDPAGDGICTHSWDTRTPRAMGRLQGVIAALWGRHHRGAVWEAVWESITEEQSGSLGRAEARQHCPGLGAGVSG